MSKAKKKRQNAESAANAKVRLPAERLAPINEEMVADGWEHAALLKRVQACLYLLPDTFRVDVQLPTIPASDLAAANTLLGSTIEDHIPIALNRMRDLWDRDNDYPGYVFRRQPQTFPDVIFVRQTADTVSAPLFGIEVKGWYLLSKEKEPSFRLTVSRQYCSTCDMAVVVPWALSSGVSGTVKLFKPLVIGTKHAARIRNEYWEIKGRKVNYLKEPSNGWIPYPTGRTEINDAAVRDKGKNFGRIARTGVWDKDIELLLDTETISGIPLKGWHYFLKQFSSGKNPAPAVEKLRRYYEKTKPDMGNLSEVTEALDALLESLASVDR